MTWSNKNQSDTNFSSIEPSESDKEDFLNKLGTLMPKSAALTAAVKLTSEPTLARIIQKLPPTLATLYNVKYKDLQQCDLRKVCESVFGNLSITTDEAKYLEESTRL